MKNKNLLNWLWTGSHEKQSPQRFARYAAMLIMLLTLGVGQMWGMTFGASTIYFDNTNANFTNPCLYIWSGGYNETWQMTKVSGSDCYWTYTRSSAFDGDGFLFKDKNTWTGQSSNITDSYNSGWWTNCYSKELGWKIVGPKSMSKSNTTETEAGSGTSGSKYIVKEGTKITVSASGTKIDPNHTVEYKFNDGSWSTTNTYTVVNSAVAATDYSVTVYVRTKRGDLTSREFNLGTIYYRGETKYSVKAVASPVAGGSVTPTSNTAMGQYTGGTITASENTGYTFTGWTGGSGTYADASEETTTFKPTAASTVTANFSENMSTVTLTASPSGKGSFTIGGAAATSTTAGVTTTRSVTAVPIAGYSFSGWSITGGATISSTTANPTTVTGAGAGAAATLTATFVEDLTYYDVTFAVGTGYTSLGSISAMNNTTSSAISSGDDILSASNITLTATPNTGYVVEGWYTNAACTEGKHDAGSTTYTIASLSSDVTVYVKFVEKTWSVAFAAGTGGTVTTPAATPQTVGQVTGISIAATPATGYTFNTWTITSGSGSFTSAATTNSNTFKPTAASTITASFNEKKSTITVATATTSWGSLKFGGTSKSWGATASLGVATTQSITATAASGYKFVRWDLSGAAATSSSTTSSTITLKADGSGSTGTATAVFEEDLSSPWVLKGGTNITGDNWSTEHAMTKKTGHSTENVAYYTANISSTNSGTSGTADAWSFKLIKNSTWYGLTADGSYWWKRSTSANQSLTTSGANIQICADVAGTYEIKVDYSTATPKITVTFPTKYTVTYSVSPSGAASAITTSPSVTSGGSVASGTSMTFTHAAAKTGYSWYRWENGSGSSLGTGSTYTTTINANTTVVAKYTENTYNVTATASAGGSATPASATAMGQITGGDITASPNTGYNFTNWTITSGSGYFGASGTATTSTTANTKFRPTAAATIQANFTPKTTTITLNNQDATTPGSTSVTATYDAAMPAITLPTKTGYTFGGYWGSPGGSGPQYYNADGSSTQNWNNENSTYTLFAKWTAKTTTITLDQTGAASAGCTYDADMPAITGSGSRPTAPQGYAFMGYYDALEPLGTKYYNADGTSAHTWDKEDASFTLHAYFKKAEITTLALSAGTVLPEGSITATATIEPTPTGTTKICWKLLYNSGTEYSPQPTFTPESGNVVSFNAPEASGTYKVRAQLRTGSECGAGTLLSEQVASFVVAGTHTVTIQYKCGDVTVKSSTVVEGVKPLEWSEEITPDEIFGYSFEKWVAGDGVTMTINGGGTTIETGGETTGKATTHAVQIKAIYDGKLIAKYTKKNIIYFKNTLGWTNVYYHDSYWDNGQGGAGNKGQSHINQAMSLVQGTTNIYYWEGTPTSANVAFTNATYDNYQAFWSKTFEAKVVYPSNPTCASSGDSNYGYNAGTPMFVPVEQDGQDFNAKDGGKAIYYNKGYWRAYDPTTGESGSTGYTLKIYNQTEGNSSRELLQSIPFTNADASGQIFKASINLEAAKGYGIKVERDNSLMYTKTTGHLNRTGDVETLSVNPDNYAAIWIKSTAAGDYDFIITCNGSGELCLQATFPAAKNDYRVLYTDNATWSTAHTAHTWVHPSRVISAEVGATDTISFFVSKDNSPEYKIQKVSSINEETGAITWTDVSPSWTSISVDETGVYNFIFNQPSAGSISLSKTEAYTGSYYIRTDNAGSTKWENYRAEDHKMTYSEYAAKITHTGEEWKDFTHYFMKYVDKDKESGKYKNVKFTVANDYSPCISHTLVQQAGDITPNHVNDAGELQANANIRFMWNSKNNKLQRAYLAAAQTDGSKFLVLQGQSGKLLAPDGTPLSDANGNNHRGGTDAIQFTDKEHWMYEAEVKDA